MGKEKKNWKKELLWYSLMIVIAIVLSRGIHFIVGLVLNTPTPFLVVASGSMEPTLNIGDIIVIRGVRTEDLKVGDIIVFNPPKPYYNGIPWVHRIISIQSIGGEKYFRTKGDANLYPDPFTLTKENIIGIVIWKIPYLGLISLRLWQWVIPITLIISLIIILKLKIK
ncbi:MAG: signal peptidase I [Candidatus Methanomethylicia archaeon]|nr:signal peptidase I [Candidatus Methanomethylicia archaeon]MDW7988522.1 signal peptidase I [Nitrososphaerota archaeon]